MAQRPFCPRHPSIGSSDSESLGVQGNTLQETQICFSILCCDVVGRLDWHL
ncbi:hypothetical protein HBI56_043280 [Parastagonospora nodorum]|uniref:Uncharacterized protein n=1 Tax=Phaeosphaeria nodorum (strain SN15 / ATCC MYA-4574 / FGSC 10173) TaxID=321614 RepID=A0A7U2EU42_PHANO|nr:hypothetical protein HBH56_242200 [Parastagonospora nodorum]QRC93116.1 hypothetical protein JI435_403360 [Parastagonospora nodorum SN15]KAH3921145.1 hypothetical protein HBH54_244780 [Parastagonospora nodorum]KAH3955162.1 hypothetical protein HBH53_009780 [Parastagonospora nodorum]KAH3988386.1 hypothetical protein HBH51_008040 [Parastagonospora nodorum]